MHSRSDLKLWGKADLEKNIESLSFLNSFPRSGVRVGNGLTSEVVNIVQLD